MPRSPAVVFDLDGVLLDTESGWTRAETELFRRYGRTYGRNEKLALIGTALMDAGRAFEGMLEQRDRAEELLAELIELAAEDFARGVEPMPGALELVEALRAEGRPIGLASNSYRRLVDIALESSGLENAFGAVLAADEVARSKPAPDLYLEACRRLGEEPANAVAVEDSPTGVAAARTAGLFVIGVPYLPEVRLDEADLIVPSLEDPRVRAEMKLPRRG